MRLATVSSLYQLCFSTLAIRVAGRLGSPLGAIEVGDAWRRGGRAAADREHLVAADVRSHHGKASVQLSTGAISGEAIAGGAIAHFGGIPFAAPPTQNRRFMPPEQLAAWDGALDCTSQRSERRAWPVQPPDAQVGGFAISEDSLQLDVWAPAANIASIGKASALERSSSPVLFWIYGGGLTSGSKDYPGQEGTPYAERGLVFVAPNYRVGVLGFLQPKGGAANMGLLDLVAALKWVHAEAGAFGGDPSSITIMGESGGADCALWLAASPIANKLFHRVVVQSPSAFTITLAQAAEMTEEFARVSGATSTKLEDLQKLTVEELLHAQVNGTFRRITPIPGWRFMQQSLPSGDPTELAVTQAGLLVLPEGVSATMGWPMPAAVVDGELFPQEPLEALQQGVGKHLDFVVGGNRDEDAWEALPGNPNQPDDNSYGTQVQTVDDVARRAAWEVAGMPKLQHAAGSSKLGLKKIVANLTEVYQEELLKAQTVAPAASNVLAEDTSSAVSCSATAVPWRQMGEGQAQLLQDSISTDCSFLAAVQLICDRLAGTGHAKALYRYQFQGVGKNELATHGSELAFMLGEERGEGTAAGEKALRNKWLDSWASFARTGNPNLAEMEDKWPKYSEVGQPVLLWDGVCGWSVVGSNSSLSPVARPGLQATAKLWEELWELTPIMP